MDAHQSSLGAQRQQVLRALLKAIGNGPLVLKGGAALVFVYDSDRSTNDLDFDSDEKIRKLDARIRHVQIPGVQITAVDVIKDTPTVTRLRVRYTSEHGDDSIKIEVSHRGQIDPAEVQEIDGVHVASLKRILDQKLRAAYDGDHPRTKARDLYDIDFIIRKYPEAVTEDLAERIHGFAADPELLRGQYAEAFEEEEMDADLDDIVLRLHERSKEILDDRKRDRGRSNDDRASGR